MEKLGNCQGKSLDTNDFQGKNLKIIDGTYYVCMNEKRNNMKKLKIQRLYRRPNIILNIRNRRLKWFGHVWTADKQIIKLVH